MVAFVIGDRADTYEVLVRRLCHGCKDVAERVSTPSRATRRPVVLQAWASSRPFSVGSFLIAFPVFVSASRSSYML